MQQYKENKEELKKLLKNFTEAVIVLAALRETGKKELLPVFAAASTGNPHYFDEGTTAEKLLSFYLRWRFGTEKCVYVVENPAIFFLLWINIQKAHLYMEMGSSH